MNDLEARLTRIVQSTPWLMRLLRIVRDVGVPEGYVAAGAIRDTVWDALFGRHGQRAGETQQADVDVVYFELENRGRNWQDRLAAAAPDVQWEATNQALVHRWQGEALGRDVAAYRSVADAVGAWPETATAVAVRLTNDRHLEVLAPCGLADLFEGIVRRNPVTPDREAFARRVAERQWQRRWRELRVVE